MVAGLAIIADAIYLAVRPYLRHDLMPDGDSPWDARPHWSEDRYRRPARRYLLYTTYNGDF